MKLTLDHTQRLNLHALLGEQRGCRSPRRSSANDHHIRIRVRYAGHERLRLHDEPPRLHLESRQTPDVDRLHRHTQAKRLAQLA